MEVVNLVKIVMIIAPMLFVVLLIHSLRLSLYLDSKADVFTCLRAISMSLTFGLFLPARSGELIKPLYISNVTDIKSSQAMGAVVLERLIDVVSFVFVSVSLSLMFGYKNGYMNVYYMVCILISLTLFLCVLVIKRNLVSKLLKYLGLEKISIWIDDFFYSLMNSITKVRSMKLFILGLVAWYGSFLIYFVFFGMISSFEVTWLQSTMLFFSGTLGLGLALTPGGIGTFEGAISAVLYSYNYTLSDSLFLAVIFRVIISLPAALICIIDILKNYKQCKRFYLELRKKKYAK